MIAFCSLSDKRCSVRAASGQKRLHPSSSRRHSCRSHPHCIPRAGPQRCPRSSDSGSRSYPPPQPLQCSAMRGCSEASTDAGYGEGAHFKADCPDSERAGFNRMLINNSPREPGGESARLLLAMERASRMGSRWITRVHTMQQCPHREGKLGFIAASPFICTQKLYLENRVILVRARILSLERGADGLVPHAWFAVHCIRHSSEFRSRGFYRHTAGS